jgi:hypothetical protein
MVAPASLKFLYSFLYREHINHIQGQWSLKEDNMDGMRENRVKLKPRHQLAMVVCPVQEMDSWGISLHWEVSLTPVDIGKSTKHECHPGGKVLCATSSSP